MASAARVSRHSKAYMKAGEKMGRLILVTGGARSGKSSFGEKYAARYGKRVAYIATSQIWDSEMEFRVKLHRQRRPASWHTYEAPYEAHKAVEEAARSGCDMILFDCLTVYASNLLCSLDSIDDSDRNYRLLRESCQSLIEAVKKNDCTMVVVTNEVGAGIVPENHLAREFRDLAGLANQMLAAAAEEVYLTVAGIPVNIKKLAENLKP